MYTTVQYILLNHHKNSAEEHCLWLYDAISLTHTIIRRESKAGDLKLVQ